ncbi:ATP-grasp domain-containing protein [Micromonospora sp. NPDC005979]|uniref:ATP-grasp domain-containing protein n=1 Tax=Micromonospora sp. NPDC005979 TaxID=3156726 RepID=UPI0033A6760D
METILIVGGRVETLVKARELGLRVLFMQHRDRMLPGHVEAADALFMVDYTDWNLIRPIVLAAHASYGFTAVVSLGEQVMETVGRINDLLGLGGTSYEVAARFKDKLAMRAHLAESSVATVAAEQVDAPEQVRDFGRRHGFPIVLKPIDNTASRGVQIIEQEEGVLAAWQAVTALRTRDDLILGQFFPVGRMLVEQYIAGPEYSVETFSFGGRHSVVAITEKYTDGVVEAAHALPARLTDADETAVVAYVRSFLSAMGLRDGVAHTEIKLSPGGPVVIESHDRIAGERIPDLVRDAYEIDLEQYAVASPFGLLPELPDRPEPLRAAATRFINAEPGIVTGIAGTEDVLSHPALIELDMFVKEGDRRVPVTDNFERSGQVLATGVDTAAALETCDLLAGKIAVLTTPGASD